MCKAVQPKSNGGGAAIILVLLLQTVYMSHARSVHAATPIIWTLDLIPEATSARCMRYVLRFLVKSMNQVTKDRGELIRGTLITPKTMSILGYPQEATRMELGRTRPSAPPAFTVADEGETRTGHSVLKDGGRSHCLACSREALMTVSGTDVI